MTCCIFSSDLTAKSIIMKQQLLLFFGLLCFVFGQSQAIFNDGVLEYTVTDATNHYVSVRKYNTCPLGTISVPETIDYDGETYIVASLANSAFEDCTALQGVNLPSSLKTVGKRAFYGSGITNITIPQGVTTISDQAFNNSVFLQSVNLPTGLEHIGGAAFYGCNRLSNINFPMGLISIGVGAFGACHALIQANLPEGLTTLKEGAFANCTSLQSVSIPNSVTTIEPGVFKQCSNLNSVVLPEGLIALEKETFMGCTNLTSVTLPNGLESIAIDAFRNCTSLATLDIPESVTHIANYAFDSCTGLTEVVVHWETPLPIVRGVFRAIAIENVSLTVPAGTLAAYLAADVWKEFDVHALGNPDFVVETTLRLYPNPVSEFLHIKLHEASELKRVAIYNGLGQMILNAKEVQINVSNYSKGIYYAQIETNTGTTTKKFVVR